MSRQSWTKLSAVCLLAALLGAFWAASDAAAGNKKSNPSPQGQANGVAHRVAALEATVAAQEDRIAALEGAAMDLADAVLALQSQVAGLEARVLALESAAATTP
jgi:uncharacterized coiled-coil protein SlyX